MKRLITFGCSLTQGQALEKDVEYSKLAWPYVLADQLNLQCINMGRNGASIKRIWWNIMNFKFEATDIVVILWTHLDRWCIIKEGSKSSKETDYDLLEESKTTYLKNTKGWSIEDINVWFNDKDQKYMKLWYENFHDNFDMLTQATALINHAQYYLKDTLYSDKGKSQFHFSAADDKTIFNINEELQFNEVSFGNVSFNDIRRNYPKALDNHHPGKEAHEKFAYELKKQIEIYNI